VTADEIIAALNMRPHPEGGHYVETYRDERDGARARSSAIYFLLRAGERSHWHRIDAAEHWLWHAGAPLTLAIADPAVREIVLGPDLSAGQRPQATVPPHAWQGAASTGAWTLVSCVVAPGFEFASFELAAPGWVPD
jgi:predicted cupin superfamily sugar epimerase